MSTPRLKAISQEQYKTWFEQGYATLQHRSPYHQPAWLEAVASGVGFELGFIGVYEGSDLAAVVPGFLTRRGPFRLFGSPLRGTVTSYLGPVGFELSDRPEKLIELASACKDFARREWGAAYTRFTLRDAPVGGGPVLGSDWEQQRPGSYRLDLTRGEEALWKGLESDCRRNVRKAQRVGIETVPFDDAHRYYQILDETFRRHGTTSWHPERFFSLMLAGLTPQDLLWAWGARYEGSIVAVCLFLHDDREVHFISGASHPQWGSLPTSYHLHWQAIQTAARAGLRVYNSDASRIPSIDQFKESFRPTLDQRHTMIWAPGVVRYAQNAYMSANTYLRRFRGWARRA